MNTSLVSQLYLKDTAFHDLMQQRIFNVMLIASTYDAFMLEEDGRIEEQIFLEYVSLNLSSPPRVTLAGNYEEARAMLAEKHFDLIIAMPGGDVSVTFSHAASIKEQYPHIPFVVLTPFSREVSRRLAGEDFSGVDYVFSWLGNVDLLVAIIKLLEDKMNAQYDVLEVGVQMILLVEDSVRFYSSVLPALYKFVLNQSRIFSTEALNAHEAMLRMRGRPKVMLARDYEEAMQLYDKYHDHMLGVISDVSFKREGVKDREAGLRLARELRRRDPYLPIIIESSESENNDKVSDFDGVFLDKNSKKLPVDLGKTITQLFGFGDFIVRDPHTLQEIMRLRNLKDFQYRLAEVPDESLLYHGLRNDISRWLYSRALFPIAQVAKIHRMNDVSDAAWVRDLLHELILRYRKMKNQGVVAEFLADRYDRYSSFARIGQGSLGGKGRGLAFIDTIIKRNPQCEDFGGVTVRIPHTVVLCTDIFDEFMEMNGLYPLALSNCPDSEILDAFLTARLPERLTDDFVAIYEVIDAPLAIRSSSLLEDSHYQPFAGIYATYMVPHLSDKQKSVRLMEMAVKAVYASVFYQESKAYMVATSNVIDQEKMAVIIQEVVGQQHGHYYYPSCSGVGRSLNYYPVGEEKATDGVCEVAVGLGKHIVDGGRSLRFSPRHPRHVLQTSTLQLALRDTQTTFCALDTQMQEDGLSIDEGFNIARLPIQPAADNGELSYMVSTYDYQNERLVDSDAMPGRKVVTFANVLRHDAFPLASIVDFMLTTGQQQMGRPVEVEFAAVMDKEPNSDQKGTLYWLQIRPMVDRCEMLDEDVLNLPREKVLVVSGQALGHGATDGIRAILMVKPEKFSFANNVSIAAEIEKINSNFTAANENYILIGPGRWGSSDEALGIPVKWTHISAARLIVETAVDGNRIEPSQGTHFFQNLTSYGVGYFTVGGPDSGSWLDEQYLNARPAEYESDYLRLIRFDEPLHIAINGPKGCGIVLKPGVELHPDGDDDDSIETYQI
ncbi:MAG: phosphoenolpyruvate synthase [Muribaculaceae bacterium]|nr:phosphoenolpyruvate synthase [Muribaculaceae bacterium]